MLTALFTAEGDPHVLQSGDRVTYEGRNGTLQFFTERGEPLYGPHHRDKIAFTAIPEKWADVLRPIELIQFLTGRQLVLCRINLNGRIEDHTQIGSSARRLTELLQANYTFTWQVV